MASPASRARFAAISSSGRGRLPTWLVRMWSVLVRMRSCRPGRCWYDHKAACAGSSISAKTFVEGGRRMSESATASETTAAAAADDPASRPQIVLLPRGHRRAEGGHPWVYSNEVAIDAAAKSLPAGTLVTLRRAPSSSMGERPFGVAMFNPHTLIAARLLDRDAGRAINKRFFARRLERALRLRERLYDRPYYRLLHAEADGLPGLIIDRFGAVLVVQANAAGMDRLLAVIIDALRDLLAPEAIVLRNDSPARTLEGLELETRVALGTIDGPVTIEENGVTFAADVLA